MTTDEKHRPSRWLHRILLITVVLASLMILLARSAGNWLIVQDHLPSHLDVLVTLGGEGVRIHYSERLRQRYPQATWILSAYDTRYLKEDHAQLDPGRTVLLANCASTRDEVCFLQEWLTNKAGKQEPLRVGLVSGPYHMRRVSHLARNLLEPKGPDPNSAWIQLYYLPVPLSSYKVSNEDFNHWWRSRHLKGLVPSELGKLGAEHARFMLGKECDPEVCLALDPSQIRALEDSTNPDGPPVPH